MALASLALGATLLGAALLPRLAGQTDASSSTLIPRARAALVASDPPAAAPSWLQLVNSYREMSRESDLSENTLWDAGALAHSRYMAENDVIGHSEDPSLPYYTTAGDAAAQNSNVYLGFGAGTEQTAMEGWLTGPFHAVGILDPQLTQTAFGFYRVGDRWAATLDVIRGLSSSSPNTAGYPVEFPGAGATTTLSRYAGNERPDPLAACPGYSAPTGIPVLLLLGPGATAATVQALTGNGAPVEYCSYDGTTYTNPDSASQTISREILAARGAVVIVPRQPLAPGVTYTVSVAAGGTTITWSFTVAAS